MTMRLLAVCGLAALTLVVAAFLWSAPGLVQAQDPVNDLLTRVNSARLSQGLYPYVVNSQLAAAAQRHSDDMAATGQISHTGSDGSSDIQRILEAGYGAYDFGPLVGENIYGGPGAANVPFEAWMDTPGARANLLHEKYREVGIGVANDAQGRTFWTVTFGAQPNVLPVLVNDGAASVETITVTLTLVPENAAPDGAGTAMGQPTEYRASTSSQFPGVEWEPWARQVSFVLDETLGQQTVYVQLRDAAGRTAVSWASVTLTGQNADATPTPTEAEETEPPGTATATVTTTRTPRTTLTPSATTTGTPTRTTTATARPSPTASSTPVPSPSATVTASATSSPSPPATLAPPTQTPSATSPPSPTPLREVTVAPPAPTQPSADAIAVEEETEPPSLASRAVPWALGLQAVALVLGVYLALRRSQE